MPMIPTPHGQMAVTTKRRYIVVTAVEARNEHGHAVKRSAVLLRTNSLESARRIVRRWRNLIDPPSVQKRTTYIWDTQLRTHVPDDPKIPWS